VEQAFRSSALVRFETFEVDLRSGELRKDGAKLRLSGQPFQVLAILLEHPGDVVTREELQKRLWPIRLSMSNVTSTPPSTRFARS